MNKLNSTESIPGISRFKNSVVKNINCMAENRTYYVIVAQFHCEIQKFLQCHFDAKAPAHDTF